MARKRLAEDALLSDLLRAAAACNDAELVTTRADQRWWATQRRAPCWSWRPKAG